MFRMTTGISLSSLVSCGLFRFVFTSFLFLFLPFLSILPFSYILCWYFFFVIFPRFFRQRLEGNQLFSELTAQRRCCCFQDKPLPFTSFSDCLTSFLQEFFSIWLVSFCFCFYVYFFFPHSAESRELRSPKEREDLFSIRSTANRFNRAQMASTHADGAYIDPTPNYSLHLPTFHLSSLLAFLSLLPLFLSFSSLLFSLSFLSLFFTSVFCPSSALRLDVSTLLIVFIASMPPRRFLHSLPFYFFFFLETEFYEATTEPTRPATKRAHQPFIPQGPSGEKDTPKRW